MEMSKDFDWLGLASRLFCVIVIALAAVALPTVAIRLFMPFLLSGVLCSAVISASRRLSRLVPIGERALRMILLALSFVGIAVILFNLCRRLYAEISEILTRFGKGEIRIILPEVFDGRLGEHLTELSANLLATLSGAIGAILKAVVSAAPSAILFGVSLVMFSIYFCLDYEKIREAFLNALPDSARKWSERIQKGIVGALGGFVRAYAVLFVLTFLLSLVGLCLLGRKYALTTALVIALVDMLPVLGTGAVLIPWALCSVLTSNIGLGIGLAALWLIITVVRSAVEPRIIGDSIGISPILSLVAAYAGFKAFGVLGMILAPVAAAVARSIWSAKSNGIDI